MLLLSKCGIRLVINSKDYVKKEHYYYYDLNEDNFRQVIIENKIIAQISIENVWR